MCSWEEEGKGMAGSGSLVVAVGAGFAPLVLLLFWAWS